MTQILHRFVFNFAPAKVRTEKLEGREYLVAPAAILAHGVWNGSRGPLYYPEEELRKTPVVWNHKPIVMGHPQINGEGVSACKPEVMEELKIGMMLNTNYGDKLRTEAWFDVEKTKKVMPDLLTNIGKGLGMEVSTGLFSDLEEKKGTFNGKQYEYIARNYRPDHLAVLTDKSGAYSMDDGGGLLANQKKDDEDAFVLKINSQDDLTGAVQLLTNQSGPLVDAMIAQFKEIAVKKGFAYPTIQNVETVTDPYTKDQYLQWQKDFIDNTSEEKVLIDNKKSQISHRDIANGITKAMAKEWSGKATYNEAGAVKNYDYWPGYLEDTYNDFFVYSEMGNTFYKRGYSIDGGVVNVDSKKVEVKKHQEWQGNDGNRLAVRQRDMSGSKVTKPMGVSALNVQQTQNTGDKKVTTANQNKGSMQDWIKNNAPPEAQPVFNRLFASYEAEAKRYIAIITNSPKNKFTMEQLRAKDNDELQMLALLVAEEPVVNAPSYMGADGTSPANLGGGNPACAEPVLETPVLNFDDRKIQRVA